MPRLGPHIAYSINYTRGLNRLKELKTTSEPLRNFLGKAGEAPECKKMDLEDFLIMYVMRERINISMASLLLFLNR